MAVIGLGIGAIVILITCDFELRGACNEEAS